MAKSIGKELLAGLCGFLGLIWIFGQLILHLDERVLWTDPAAKTVQRPR